jgi:hypothetical protein
MKRPLFAAFCLLVSFGVSLAQSLESFDIVTYRLSVGWQKQSEQNTLQIATEDRTEGSFCLITMIKSIPSLDSPKKSFEASWQTIVKEAITVTTAPQMLADENKGGWQALSGFASFEKNGEKGIAVLLNISGYGKMVNVLILTNTQKHETAITAFLESINLKAPEPNSGRQNATQRNEGGTTVDVVGSWGTSSSGQSNYEVNHGLSGYVKKQYTFFPNGTYEFLLKTFIYASDKLIFGKETGTYQLSGNSLTISPQKSVIQAWSKRDNTDKWGRLLSSQNKALEKVTYQVTKHYFSGIQEWQLVLQASKPTERDGPFTGNTSFANAWLYGPQKYPIQPPE